MLNNQIIFALTCFAVGFLMSEARTWIDVLFVKRELGKRDIEAELKKEVRGMVGTEKVHIPQEYQAEDDTQVAEEEEDKKNPDIPEGYNW